jgi:hypothetical protein
MAARDARISILALPNPKPLDILGKVDTQVSFISDI